MARREKLVTLKLPEMWVGQIVDGLDVLIEQWSHTADFLFTGEYDADVGVVRECNGPDEAAKIAEFYREIRNAIEEQIAERGR